MISLEDKFLKKKKKKIIILKEILSQKSKKKQIEKSRLKAKIEISFNLRRNYCLETELNFLTKI